MNDSITELPQSVVITVNSVDITCYRDGSVEKVDGRSGKLVRQFGSDSSLGYKKVKINRKWFYVHRIICQAFFESWEPKWEVDHINGEKADNRIENLRQFETNLDNQRAHQNKRAGCSSKYRFVSWHKRSNKWLVRVTSNGKQIYGGYFCDEIEAARAGDALAEKLGFDEAAFNRTKHHEV